MPEVGIRELRNNLSRYVDEVKRGGEVTVTEHGRAVARLVALDRPRLIDRLIAEGRVTPATDRRGALPTPVTAAGSVSDLVTEQRR